MLQADYDLSDIAVQTIHNINSYFTVEGSQTVNVGSYVRMLYSYADPEDLQNMRDCLDRTTNIKLYLNRIQAAEPGFKSNSGSLGTLDTAGQLKP